MYVLLHFDMDEVDVRVEAVSDDFDRLKDAAQERYDQTLDMLGAESEALVWAEAAGYWFASILPESSVGEEYRIEEGPKL